MMFSLDVVALITSLVVIPVGVIIALINSLVVIPVGVILALIICFVIVVRIYLVSSDLEGIPSVSSRINVYSSHNGTKLIDCRLPIVEECPKSSYFLVT
jgi:hypothetical protein